MNGPFKAALATFVLCVLPVMGANPPAPVNGAGGAAVRGFDVVSYFTDGKPLKGSPQFTYRWMDSDWQFSSAEHRDAFAASPVKYAPQFGGYCAWAVGHNYTADADPEAWTIVDGKLYLNYNRAVQAKWQQDRAKWIEKANHNWPGLRK